MNNSKHNAVQKMPFFLKFVKYCIRCMKNVQSTNNYAPNCVELHVTISWNLAIRLTHSQNVYKFGFKVYLST